MNIRHGCACDFSRSAFARCLVTKPFLGIEVKASFPEDAVVNHHCSMRTAVVMNRSSVSGTPTQYEHLNKLIATNSMPPIVSIFEAQVWLQLCRGNLRVFQPCAKLFEGRDLPLCIQHFNQTPQ